MLGGFGSPGFLSPGALALINPPLALASFFDSNHTYQTLAFLEDPGSRDEAQGCLWEHNFVFSIVSTLVAGFIISGDETRGPGKSSAQGHLAHWS